MHFAFCILHFTVEIVANGRYLDYENYEVKTGEHTVTLTFVFENGEWRLDTPTY